MYTPAFKISVMILYLTIVRMWRLQKSRFLLDLNFLANVATLVITFFGICSGVQVIVVILRPDDSEKNDVRPGRYL